MTINLYIKDNLEEIEYTNDELDHHHLEWYEFNNILKYHDGTGCYGVSREDYEKYFVK